MNEPRIKMDDEPDIITDEDVTRHTGGELAEWQELYYYLFGTIRNEIRTGADAKTRLDHIWDTLKESRERHLKLERKYIFEAGTD